MSWSRRSEQILRGGGTPPLQKPNSSEAASWPTVETEIIFTANIGGAECQVADRSDRR
jgi:hypothetical protein